MSKCIENLQLKNSEKPVVAILGGSKVSSKITVIENILDNALRYAKSEITIDLKADRCIIYNDGPNIPEDRIEQIFKPYEKGTGGQFGLGLAIVRRVLTAYHYTIKIKNLNIGVQFIIEKENTDTKITKDELETL